MRYSINNLVIIVALLSVVGFLLIWLVLCPLLNDVKRERLEIKYIQKEMHLGCANENRQLIEEVKTLNAIYKKVRLPLNTASLFGFVKKRAEQNDVDMTEMRILPDKTLQIKAESDPYQFLLFVMVLVKTYPAIALEGMAMLNKKVSVSFYV